MTAEDDDLYCLGALREDDHDRYLTALLLPAEARRDAIALYAYANELAKTREAVSEPILGQIRLQWWREALAGIYEGAPREHPVVGALARTVERHALARGALEALVDAREADLDDAPPPDTPALVAYADATSGALSALVMEVLAPGEAAPHRAGHAVGTAWALVGLVRAVAFHAQAKRLYLPESLLTSFEVDRRRLFELTPSAGLNRAVEEIVAKARDHLAAARAARPEIAPEARRGLLLATVADSHIAAIEKAGFDPFALPPALPPRPLRLAWAAWRGRY